ncbi:uncharacterized phosphotransferase YvkC [Caerostris darwini]|uniref:Uncharacterized phosphotransferase YvkC n=1 Tax=Caerostris darwini TaxID=1538125 RepID=A0AAV4MXL4_9ARAC|nr:uncharacterized phosphotransferase YvkC [Caerostris darwini]
MIASFIVALITAPFNIIYWIKWTITYITILLRKSFHSRKFDLYDINAFGDPVKLGYVVPPLEKELESPIPESQLQGAMDEVIFYGTNSKSECLVVRVARTCNQMADSWIYLKLADGKTYTLPDSFGFQQPFEGNCQRFTCGKLQRRWRRIFYCGMLNETSCDKKTTEEVFVKFVFLYKASSDAYGCTLDTNPRGFASAIAKAKWKKPCVPPVEEFVDLMNLYCQTGVLTGTVSVNDESDYEMYLFGEKIRNLGKIPSIVQSKCISILGTTPSNGFSFHVSEMSTKHLFKALPIGFTVDPEGELDVLKDLNVSVKKTTSEEYPSSFKARFHTGERYEVVGKLMEPIFLQAYQGVDGSMQLSFIEFEVGKRKGYGLFILGEVHSALNISMNKPIAPTTSFPESIPLTVKFTDEASHFGEISGGKGSSLGKLTRLSQKEKSFSVPKGIIVTTAAYQEFLTSEIIEAVRDLENIAYGKKGDLKEAGKRVSSVVLKTRLPNAVRRSIHEDLKDIFGDEVNSLKFAVRSSATGEDTEAMSAAGQMDTFLGVQGVKEIFLAVRKCWASQFGYIAVGYKRRNGQVLNSPMAVVIQEMVACEVSGVLFTFDPVTNNPSMITITANYGLGETVVSGTVEPDTFVLRRKKRKTRVFFDFRWKQAPENYSGGTATEDIEEDSRNESCLSKETAERLGEIAIKIEDYYKSSRDIEWGIFNDKVYILQSRPVTNVAAETDHEIKHEFDPPLQCENEYFTVASVGESLPGAISPLGLDILPKFWCIILRRDALEKGLGDHICKSKYFLTGFSAFYNRLMITVVEMINRYGFGTPNSKAYMVSIFGRILDDPELMSYAASKVTKSAKLPLRTRLRNCWDKYFFDVGLKKLKEKVDNYQLKFLEFKTAKETYTALINSCSDFDYVADRHLLCTDNSSNWNMSMFDILVKEKGSFDNDVYTDFAKLLSTTTNVESANEVADQIAVDVGCEKFKSMTAEEALEWLKTTHLQSGYKFRQFLKRHGHRCVQEYDIGTTTWEMDPKSLVKLLQGSKSSKGEGLKSHLPQKVSSCTAHTASSLMQSHPRNLKIL